MYNKYCAVILNRNLGSECDNLRQELLNLGFDSVVVVDSSTSSNLASKYVNVRATDMNTLNEGYRINRGFNEGLTFALSNYEPDWIMCLPVDSKIEKISLISFEQEADNYQKIVAYGFISSKSPYYPLLAENTGLVWNLEEGPIMLHRDFIEEFWIDNKIQIFDNDNFRGYLSFKELALRIYGKNRAIGVSKYLLVEEREEFLMNFSELMKTEAFAENKELLIVEGKQWLKRKYGFTNRWELENIVRLLHNEFILRNPKYNKLIL